MWPQVAFGLLGACGLLYGLWQRSRASSLAEQYERSQAQSRAQEAALVDQKKRYEEALALKEAQLEAFRKELDALPNPALADRFNGLFPPKTQA